MASSGSTTKVNADALSRSGVSQYATRPNISNVTSEAPIQTTDINQHASGILEGNDNNEASGAPAEITVLRGVRVRTGCNTCRKRHVKCDERKPICLNCSKGKRECVFPTVETLFRPHAQPKPASKKNDDVVASQSQTSNQATGSGIEEEMYGGWDAGPSLFVPGVVKVAHLQSQNKPTAVETSLLELATVAVDRDSNGQYLESDESHTSEPPISLKGKGKARQQAVAPEIPASYVTQDLEQVEVQNTLLPSLYPPRSIMQTVFDWPPSPGPSTNSRRNQDNDLSGTYGGRRNDQGSSYSQDVEPNSRKRRRLSNDVVKPHRSPIIASAKATLPLSSSDSQFEGVTGPLPLSPSQAYFFRNYVENLAPELDLFDLDRHFSQTIPRLARRTEALLHACLAFSGKSVYLTGMTDGGYDSSNIQAEVMQHYDMALRDMQSSLIGATNNKFDTDQSMLATAVLLCAFDNFEGGRHSFVQHTEALWTLMLRPSFSRDGGVKQTVFWSLFTQDLMTAFFAKRKTYLAKDFWQFDPLKDTLESLRDDELACRVVYLAAQIVNFCVDQSGIEDVSIIGARSQLLELELIKWKKALPETFEPLIELPGEAGLKELWFTLPLHGVALQIYHWAYIILVMHRPVNNIQDYITREQRYRLSSPYIIGVALGQAKKMPLWIGVQCLLLAGLVLLNEAQRNIVQSLFHGCQAAKGIPTRHLSEMLDKIWFNPKRWNHTYLWYDVEDPR